MDPDALKYIFFGLYWVVFVYSIVLHELAHGYSSFRLGDPTALKAGRLTLNPVRHIDPFMSVLLPVVLAVSSQGTFVFGGAKPVPINPFLYRNMRSGMLTSAACGPLTNLVLAVVFALLMKLSLLMNAGDGSLNAKLFSACMILNLMLALFNMLPIPPLDGSHMLSAVLPRDLREAYERMRTFGLIILILLLVLPFSSSVIGWAMKGGARLFLWALNIRGGLPAYSSLDILR
ncbi:MAG TPA: site-2 protease family protein [Planctomycetota bacterium]|nr:site-2 protease family protein [Planctomycetota bacterium]